MRGDGSVAEVREALARFGEARARWRGAAAPRSRAGADAETAGSSAASPTRSKRSAKSPPLRPSSTVRRAPARALAQPERDRRGAAPGRDHEIGPGRLERRRSGAGRCRRATRRASGCARARARAARGASLEGPAERLGEPERLRGVAGAVVREHPDARRSPRRGARRPRATRRRAATRARAASGSSGGAAPSRAMRSAPALGAAARAVPGQPDAHLASRAREQIVEQPGEVLLAALAPARPSPQLRLRGHAGRGARLGREVGVDSRRRPPSGAPVGRLRARHAR